MSSRPKPWFALRQRIFWLVRQFSTGPLDKNGRLRLGIFYCDMPKGIFLKGKTTVFINGDSYQLGKRIGPTVRINSLQGF